MISVTYKADKNPGLALKKNEKKKTPEDGPLFAAAQSNGVQTYIGIILFEHPGPARLAWSPRTRRTQR